MKRQRRNMLILSVVISAVILYAFFLQYRSYWSNLDSLGQMSLQNYQSQLMNTREMNLSSTELIFKEVIASPEVVRVMAGASGAAVDERAVYESEMEGLLQDQFTDSLSERYSSIIFYLADESVLYVLSDTAGQGDVRQERELVSLVHRSQNPMYGYEDGTDFGGMRYIYPVFFEDEYVGAVQFSVPSDRHYRQMQEMFDCTCTQIISGEHLEKRSVGVNWEDYQESAIGGYYLEKTLADDFLSDENIGMIDSIGGMDELEILSGVLKEKDFVVSERVEGRYFSMVFLAFSTIDGQHVGYEVFFEEHQQADYIYQAFVSNSVLLTVLWILVMASLFSIQKNREIQMELSGKDHLTQIGNRSMLDEVFTRETQRIERYGGVLSLVIFDIDGFKRINDQYGHLAGDRILIEVSDLVNRTIRSTDMLIRWGGDEFIILLPGITLGQAHKVAVKIQDKVASYAPGVKGLDRVYISVGASEYEPGENIDSLVYRADQEMYANKKKKDERFDITFV